MKLLLMLKTSFLLLTFFTAASGAALEMTPDTTSATKPVVEMVNTAGAAAKTLATSAAEKVSVVLEWDEIAGARTYELEFQDLNGRVLNHFKSSSHVFKFKFKVGKYIVRSRVSDHRNVYGEWSATTSFTVQPKPALVSAKSIATTGVIDARTLKSNVKFHWGLGPGASRFRVRVFNEKNEIVKEALITGFQYTTGLEAGIYTATLTSISAEGIESEPVLLPGQVTITTVQLPKPVLIFEEGEDSGNPTSLVNSANPKVKTQRLAQKDGVPILRWKANSLADTVGILEYRYFFGEEWVPVHNFSSKSAQEVILTQAMKPGRYRITVWAEAKGLKKSESTTYEFVIKPKDYGT